MALSLLTATVFNAPYGIDETNQRMWLRGKLVFSGTSGTYAVGGLLPNFASTVASVAGALSALKDESGANVLLGTYTCQQQTPILITSVTVSGANVTLLTKTPPVAGQFVTLGRFDVAALKPLNGITAQVTTATPGTSFVVAITATTATTSANPGQAMLVIGPDDMEIHSVAGSGYIYQYNKKFATVQIFLTGTAANDPLNELGATTTPSTGVTGDIIHFVASWVKL